jgi:hypothetical protein
MKVISDLNQASLVDRSLNAVWHPCTQMKHHESFPLVAIAKGKGAGFMTSKEMRCLIALALDGPIYLVMQILRLIMQSPHNSKKLSMSCSRVLRINPL